MTDPVRYADLSARLKVILAGRGKTARFGTDLVVQDDGSGPWLRHWDAALLGPVPTQAEVEAVNVDASGHNAGIDAQIAALEAAKPGYVRGVREFMLGVSQIIAQLPGAPNLLQTPGMQNVKALDDAIAALRAQRRA